MPLVIDYLAPFDLYFGSKAKELYQDRYLSYIRYVQKYDIYYIHGRCHAEMKKGVTYLTDVCVDENAIVLEYQCECGTGMGPVPLYACEDCSLGSYLS